MHFELNYQTVETLQDEWRREMTQKLEALTREIYETQATTREDLERLYRSITQYLVLRADIGPPTDITTVRESSAALERCVVASEGWVNMSALLPRLSISSPRFANPPHSILPPQELHNFIALTRKEKGEQLEDLTSICKGIRLFNKQTGKGGAGITDGLCCCPQTPSTSVPLPLIPPLLVPLFAAPAAVTKEGTALLTQLEEVYTQLSERALALSSAVTASGDRAATAHLVLARQLMAYTQVLQADLLDSSHRWASLGKALARRLELLRGTIESRSAVPTDQVYVSFPAKPAHSKTRPHSPLPVQQPQFIELSEVWGDFQMLVRQVQSLDGLLEDMKSIAKDVFVLPEGLAALCESAPTDAVGVAGLQPCVQKSDRHFFVC